MSNKENETKLRPQDINVKKWYKSPKLPWGLILAAVLFIGGAGTGWMLRSDMNAKVDAEVVRQFESFSKAQK